MKKNNYDIPPQDTGTFNLSISDLMSGLLAIFILALCYFMLIFNAKTDHLTENHTKRTELIQSLQKDIQAVGIKVDIDEKKGVLRIPEEALKFEQNSAEVSNCEVVLKIGNILLKTLTQEKYNGKVETVFVEGHTDSDPIVDKSRFESNWELSSQRAINTWSVMCLNKENIETQKMLWSNPQLVEKYQENKKLAQLQNKYYLDKEKRKYYLEYLFSCSGYAETRPIVDNDNDEHKSKNRRIDIRFTMVPPSAEDNPIVTEIEKEIQVGDRPEGELKKN